VTPAPIGVFDSGVGGLSILRELQLTLPDERFVYVADDAFCPYGARPEAEIRARAFTICDALLDCEAKLVVVACNTATVAAIEALREAYALPFVGTEPAVKPAALATRSGIVGILATGAALGGERFERLVARHGDAVEVLRQPCPGLVEQIELGDLEGPRTRALVERFVRPLIAAGADTLVLGCTHYPFIRPLIEAVAGPAIAVIDTGAAVARRVAEVVSHEGLEAPTGQAPRRPSVLASGGRGERIERVVAALYGTTLDIAPLRARARRRGGRVMAPET